MNVITINREFGSGGRELGKRLADALGYDYYDKEIIDAIAKKSNLDVAFVDKALEDGSWRKFPITYNHTFSVSC